MNPLLWTSTIGGVTVEVRSYATFVILAAVICCGIFVWLARRAGFRSSDTSLVLATCGGAFLLGARVIERLAVGSVSDPGAFLYVGGFSVLGGAACATAAGLAICRLRGLDPWQVADMAAPCVGVGIAVARVGCLLGGCCFGLPYSGFGAIAFPVGSPAWSWQTATGWIGPLSLALPVWPVEPVESIATLMLAGIALRIGSDAQFKTGSAAVFFAAGYLVARLALSFVRAPGGAGLGVLYLGWIAVAVGAATWLYLISEWRARHRRSSS
jgi:prolipoprotein diacylglyceryltransferase